MMSEHLAGMNERLTEQKDEIDLLKYQLQQQAQQNAKVLIMAIAYSLLQLSSCCVLSCVFLEIVLIS